MSLYESARMSLYEMLFPTGDAPYPSIRGSPLVGDSILWRRFPEIAGWTPRMSLYESARMSLYEMLFPTGDAPYPSIRGSPLVGDSIL